MKRRTSMVIITCATLGGILITAAEAASATPNIRPQGRGQTAQTASASPRKAQAPAEKVTVQPGESLTAIGARISRTWVQLAAYNGILNPDLITPGEVLNIPPAGYVPAPVSTTAATSSAAWWHATPGPVGSSSGIWGCIASHESGGNPGVNTGNGYCGMYQDTQSSWVSGGGLAYAPRADLASAAAQTAVNQRLQAQQGWAAWPVTSRMCGA